MVYHRLVGQSRWIMHLFLLALFRIHHIRHIGHGCNDIHVKLTVESLLHNLHVEQAKESTTEAKAQGNTRLGLERQRRIVQLKLLKRRTQVLVVGGINGIDTGKHHRLHFLETFDGLVARTVDVRDGIAHLHFLCILNTRYNVANLTRREFSLRNHIHLQHTHLIGGVLHSRIEELHLVALPDASVLNLKVGNDAAERVIDRVKDQCLKRSRGVTHGMRHTLDDSPQDVFNAFARLSRCTDNLLALASQQFHDFILHLIRHSTGHVNLVNDGNDLQIVLNGHVEVRDGLRLHTLCGIDHQ